MTEGKVTFDDGKLGKIQSVGPTDISNHLQLVNTYFVKGLKSNLISISQLRDQVWWYSSQN